MTERTEKLAEGVYRALCATIIYALILCAVRVIFIAYNVGYGIVCEEGSNGWLMVINALRFDIQASAYCALPVLAIGVLETIVPRLNLMRVNITITCITATIVTFAGMGDIVYYSHLGRHLGSALFGFFDEEPMVLIRGIWRETPVVTIMVGIVLTTIVVYFITQRAYKKTISKKSVVWMMIALGGVAYAIGMRGSVTFFPLRSEDTYVSTSEKVNDCVPNALYMLKQALGERRSGHLDENADQRAQRMGFADAKEAIKAYTGKETATWVDALSDTTGDEPKCMGMNVVVILCESWGARLMDYEKMYGLDLLGEMRRHAEEDIVFRKFLSSTNGTIHAVENLCMGTICENIFSSAKRHKDNPYASARIFADNGYEAYFVTGISLGWRNLREALPHQGFEHVAGRYEIMREMDDAECNSTWGVYDHSMLRYVNMLLERQSEKPKFIVCLTSTSHTPFEFPDGYEFAELRLGENTKGAFCVDDNTAREYLHGYQYESNELGHFMTRVKASAVGSNSVVAITGDHNIRRILKYGEGTINEEWQRYAVPLYLYAPVEIKADTSRYGSHDDIIPTLANLTLRNAQYIKIGQDLLADTLYSPFAINADAEFVLGCADAKARKSAFFY